MIVVKELQRRITAAVKDVRITHCPLYSELYCEFIIIISCVVRLIMPYVVHSEYPTMHRGK